MSKGEEIFNAAMSTMVREGYPVLTEEHPFLARLISFMSDKQHWIGTATDLLYEMNDHSTPANTVTKLLRRFELELYHRGRIEVVFRRTNRKRIVSIFSGLLFCADCGKKLYYSTAHQLKENKGCFVCSTYRKNSDACSAHYIREKVVYDLVLENIRRVFLNVQLYEVVFLKKQMDCYNAEKQKELSAKRKELAQMQKRVDEIDNLILRIYEDNVSQKISDERFSIISRQYETEQSELKARIPELEQFLSEETDKTVNLQHFTQTVKSIINPTELTPELLNEFIDKIVVSSPHYLDGKRYQLVDVYYKGVGIVNEMTPEEAEASFQESLADQRRRKELLAQQQKTA